MAGGGGKARPMLKPIREVLGQTADSLDSLDSLDS